MEANPQNYVKLAKRAIAAAKIVGIYPLKPYHWYLSKHLVVCLTIITILQVYWLASEKLEFKKLSNVIESAVATGYGWLKTGTLIFKRKELLRLLTDIRQFWGSKTIKSNIMPTLRLTQKAYFVMAVSASASFALRPYITHDLPILAKGPPFIPNQLFILFDQTTFCLYGFVLAAVDVFSATAMLLITLQFKILQEKIHSIKFSNWKTANDFKQCQRDIKKCVEHHYFLLEYVDVFNSYNNINILIQLFLAEGLICTQLITIAKNPNDMTEVPKCILALFILLVQNTIIYTWPAACLTEEAANLKLAIYDSDWIDCDSISIRKQLLIIMSRTQKDVEILGGPFFIINMTTSTMVFKTAYMMFTYLNTMSGKST